MIMVIFAWDKRKGDQVTSKMRSDIEKSANTLRTDLTVCVPVIAVI